MKKKVFMLMLAFALIATLAFAGGKKETKETPTTAPGEPQYGGTLTVWMKVQTDDPESPDIMDGFSDPTQWHTPVQQCPVRGDFEKYGPRGTGEYDFQLLAFIPDQYLMGEMLESWEIHPDRLIWNVRKGLMWQGRDVMESREVVAEDIVADLTYFREAPGGKTFKKFSTKIYSTGKYSLVIETSSFNVQLFPYIIGYEDRAKISPPEIQGSKKWEDQVGTGPFMFKEYVVGSHMAWERNPTYWETTTIDGKEYKLPFVDEMIWPIIPDESTQVAALRTGKLDFHHKLFSSWWETLDKSAPWLKSSKASAGEGMGMTLLNTQPPFDDVNVRRALMIGTDTRAFAELQGVDLDLLPVHWYPIHFQNKEVYTPLEELPEEDQLLYKYNPELAKKMLADAGYPNGFKMKYYQISESFLLDRAALMKDQWAKFGVEVEIVPVTTAAYEDLSFSKTYTDSIYDDAQITNPIITIGRKTSLEEFHNKSQFYNEEFAKLGLAAISEVDTNKRNALMKAASLILMHEVNIIPTDALAGPAHYWGPWLKNYYGERCVSDNDFVSVLARAWIDEAEKKRLGF